MTKSELLLIASLLPTVGACSGGGEASTPPVRESDLPLADPAAPGPTDGVPVAFRMTKLFFGDTDWSGRSDANAWQLFGHDADGFKTTVDTAAHCQLRAGARAGVRADAESGVDNSFGKNLLPLVLTMVGPDYARTVTARLAAGEFTSLIAIAALGPQASYSGMHVSFGAGAPLGRAPSSDGSDRWPLIAPLLDLGAAYLVNRTLVAGPSANDAALLLDVNRVALRLPVARLVLTMDIAPDGRSATHGIVSGILRTDEVIQRFREAAPAIAPATCNSKQPIDLLAAMLAQIGEASDILTDGTQDPSRECDGISFGMGFEARAVNLGDVVPSSVVVAKCK